MRIAQHISAALGTFLGIISACGSEQQPEDVGQVITSQYDSERSQVCAAVLAVMSDVTLADCADALKTVPVRLTTAAELPCTNSSMACYRPSDATVYTTTTDNYVVSHELVHAVMDAFSDDPVSGVEHSMLFWRVMSSVSKE